MPSSFLIEPLEGRRLLSAVVDLRLRGTGGKTVTVSGPTTIYMEAWLTVTGADANLSNDGVQGVIGSILSTDIAGGVAGGSLTFRGVAPFNGDFSTNGQQADLDGDRDLDVGSNSSESSPGYFLLRANEMQTSGAVVSGKSKSFKFADVTFYAHTMRGGTRTEINYRPRPVSPGYATAVWMEDGVRNGGEAPQIGAPVRLIRPSAPTALMENYQYVIGASSSHSFKVTYYDDSALNVSTIGGADLRVFGPNGFNAVASFVSVDKPTNGTPRVATYRINAPGGTWDPADNGTYTVKMLDGRVSDTAGNSVAARTLGTIQSQVSDFGSISGSLFTDYDGDGVKDAGEPFGFEGKSCEIYLDVDKDGMLDSGERSSWASNVGYSFGDVPNGAYRVRMIKPAGTRISAPATGYFDITVVGGHFLNKNFGLTRKVYIRGTVFNDSNGDKLRSAGEGGLSGWRVFIDADRDGIFDSTEKSALTNNAGFYSFTSLPAGTYVVRLVQQSGWTRTTTASSYTTTLWSGQISASLNFGQKRIT